MKTKCYFRHQYAGWYYFEINDGYRFYLSRIRVDDFWGRR